MFAIVSHPHGIGVKDGLFVLVASELIHSGEQGAIMPFGNRQRLDAPGLTLIGVDGVIVGSDTPVGANHSVKSCLFPQQFGDDVSAVVHGYILAVGSDVPGDSVKAHHCAGTRCGTIEAEGAVNKRFHP